MINNRTVEMQHIRITCKVSDFLPLESIGEFQGALKKRDRYDIGNIKKSLLKYGVTFPFFIWEQNKVLYCLDGHGRRLALIELSKQGYIIPLSRFLVPYHFTLSQTWWLWA
jgi:hypothetical protein